MAGSDKDRGKKQAETGWKRRLLLAGAAVLVLTGCGAGGKNALAEENGVNDVVLTAFVQQAVTTDSGIWEGWAARKLYEDTNIKMEFYPTGTGVEQKLKQYMASGNLPDIIGFKDLDQAQMAMDAGLLLPLDMYEKFLPSVFKTEYYEKAVAYSREYNSGGTGHMYIMPTSIGPVSDNAYNWMPMLQWDTYKKAGKPQVKTLEDYLDVVEKMVEIKPYTQNGEKVYGFSLFTDWDKYSILEIAALSYFYGIDTEYISPLMETNVLTKTTSSILDEDSFYKRALHFYYEANKRGLLDPDSMTQSYSNLEKKFSQGRIMFSWFSWLTGTYNDVPSGHVNNKYIPDGYVNIPADDMKIYEAPDQSIGRNWYFAVSNTCREPKKACEFLNWFYDPEVEKYLYNGPEGCLWNYDKEKTPKVTEEGWEIINNKSEDRMPLENGGSFADGIEPFNALGLQASTVMEDGYTISYRYWPDSGKNNETLVQREVNEFLGSDTIGAYLEKNDMIAKSTMAVNMIPTASDEMKTKVSAIGEVVRDLSWKMVYAQDEQEFTELWESMRAQAGQLGMEQVETYYRNAWEAAVKKVEDYE
ncbi:extracellular solute-binding protein [Blautia producta]|uniref:extracellular solute-binding protein n=1 Tax=Blautia producta TaxID=33035 RepID=UPI0031B5FB9F